MVFRCSHRANFIDLTFSQMKCNPSYEKSWVDLLHHWKLEILRGKSVPSSCPIEAMFAASITHNQHFSCGPSSPLLYNSLWRQNWSNFRYASIGADIIKAFLELVQTPYFHIFLSSFFQEIWLRTCPTKATSISNSALDSWTDLFVWCCHPYRNTPI